MGPATQAATCGGAATIDPGLDPKDSTCAPGSDTGTYPFAFRAGRCGLFLKAMAPARE
jgi:hypothetical protein